MSSTDTRLFRLADGRELAWTEFGTSDGTPVFAFHGSPGSSHHFAFVGPIAAGRGVRLIAPDRPGYGHSTYFPARSYASWADDVSQLADHLGLTRFGVIGHSSGGPNAATCARFLGDRLFGCAIVSGPAPPEAGVPPDGAFVIRVAQRLGEWMPRLSGAAWTAGLRQAQHSPDRALQWMHRALPASDVAILRRPEVEAALRHELARPVSSTAGRASVQDIHLEDTPWGFRLRDIAIPVDVWHGTADGNVDFAHGAYQAREIPQATLYAVEGAGHWIHYDKFDDILAGVLSR